MIIKRVVRNVVYPERDSLQRLRDSSYYGCKLCLYAGVRRLALH